MKKKIGKTAIITLTLGLFVTLQTFSGSVFSESSTPQAFEAKSEMDSLLASTLSKLPKDPVLAAHLEAIFTEEANYQMRIENYRKEMCKKPQLETRNQLLRESHVTDAQMLPLFKDLRSYLKAQDMNKDIATAVEQQYEAQKRWLILCDNPNQIKQSKMVFNHTL